MTASRVSRPQISVPCPRSDPVHPGMHNCRASYQVSDKRAEIPVVEIPRRSSRVTQLVSLDNIMLTRPTYALIVLCRVKANTGHRTLVEQPSLGVAQPDKCRPPLTAPGNKGAAHHGHGPLSESQPSTRCSSGMSPGHSEYPRPRRGDMRRYG